MAQANTGVQAIAKISYDDSINGLTQPWVVTADGIEIFRHATYAGCERFIAWHGYELGQDEQEIAQMEFEQHIDQQAQDLAPEYEIDSVEEVFGTLYRVWKSYHFLGSFYQDFYGKWVAQPANSGIRPRLNTDIQAQLVIITLSDLSIADAA